MMQNGMHLVRDWHLGRMGAGEAHCGLSCRNTFGHHTMHGGNNIRQLAPPPEFHSDAAVPGECAGASEHQVADAGESGEGIAAAAAGYGEAGDFGDAAGHEGGGGVVAEADAGGDAGGDGDDVFERAAEFDANDVGGGIEAEGFGRELVLDAGGDIRIFKGDGNGGGLALRDFKREAGPGERADGKRPGTKGLRD